MNYRHERIFNSLFTDSFELHVLPRVLLVGLDGASWEVLDPLISKGELPNIEKLISGGIKTRLRSTIPFVSPTAWASLFTGKNPGKHAIFGNLVARGLDPDPPPVTARDRKAKPIWTLLSEMGRRVIVINVPFTYPPDNVNGFMVSGLPIPGPHSVFTIPQSLKGEIFSRWPTYSVKPLRSTLRHRPQDWLRQGKEDIESKTQLAFLLMDKVEWDFLAIVYRDGDHLGHFHFGESVIDEYYKIVDDNLGKLFARIEEDTSIIIVSDHGQCKIKRQFFMNSWLIANGFLRKYQRFTVRDLVLLALINTLKLFGIRDSLNPTSPSGIPQRLSHYTTHGPVRAIASMLSWGGAKIAPNEIDWAKTKVGSMPSSHSNSLRVNLKGRETVGAVESKDYDAFIRMLSEKLLAIIDPTTQERIFDRILRRDDIYSGPFVEEAPDLLIVPTRGYSVSSRVLVPKLTGPGRASEGNHDTHGILLISGRGTLQSPEVPDEANILDIAPTIFHLLGCPLDPEMDGVVLDRIVAAPSLTTKQKVDDTYVRTESEKEYLREKLQLLRERQDHKGRSL